MTTLYDERKKGRKVAPDAAYLPEIEPPAKGRRIITDNHREAPKGFALRVNANGSMAFVLRYLQQGKDRLMTIGEYPTWSLYAARIQANEYRRKIDKGEDILEARRAERAEPTVSDVCDRFIKAKRRSGMKSVDDLEALFRNRLLPEVGQKHMKNLRRRDVIALVEKVADETPRTASMLLAYIKQMVAWAEDREIIEANPVATLRAEKVSPALAHRRRARVLNQAEIRALWDNAETCGLHRLTALALKLILVTGQRPGEVAEMPWSEVQGRMWTIAANRRKTGIAHTVPLTDTALAILDAARVESERLAKRRKAKSAGFVFEARPERPVTTAAMSRAVIRHAEALGNEDSSDGHWTPHDLRRTCRTGLAAAGIPEHVAELTIGHTRKGIAAVYDLHRYDAEKRKALEAWERRLLRIASGENPDENVVSIEAAWNE